MSNDSSEPYKLLPLPFVVRLPTVIAVAAGMPSETAALDLSDLTAACVETKAVGPGSTHPSTTQDITVSCGDESSSAPRTAPPHRGPWVCQVYNGNRPDLTIKVPTLVLAPSQAAAPLSSSQEERSDQSSCSDDTISSHEGSFYASLRMEQKEAEKQQQQQQQQQGRRQNPARDAYSNSLSSALTGASEQTSESSLQAEIINFGLTPTSVSPTIAITAMTPSSPFTPFSPIAQQQQQHMPQPPSYCAFRPSCLRVVKERDPSFLAMSATSRASRESNSKSGRSPRSVASSGPRTPQEFLAWRRELAEARCAREAVQKRKNEVEAEEGLANTTGAVECGPDPLNSDVVVEHAARSCSGGVQRQPRPSAFPTTVAAVGTTANVTQLESCLLPRSVTPPVAEVFHRHQPRCGPLSPCTRLADPRGPPAQSAPSPYDRNLHPLGDKAPQLQQPRQLTSSDDFSRLSQLSSSMQSSQASTETAGVRKLWLDSAPRPPAAQGKLGRVELLRDDREGWNRGEQVAMGVVLVAAVLFLLHMFFFVDVTYYLPW